MISNDPAVVRGHVDDFIEDFMNDAEPVRYARFFLMLHRLPASYWAQFSQWMEPHELYATHKETGKRWRITGASRMGDLYVKELASAPPGAKDWQPFYDARDFSPRDFKDWSSKP
jgi:hypothetical protein